MSLCVLPGTGWSQAAERHFFVDGEAKGEIRKARFEFWVPEKPGGVLVLIDGENLPATVLTSDPDWRKFAREHGLALCGAEFVSDREFLRLERGYYDATPAAGELLLKAVAKAGLGGQPLLMYGMSGGARFINCFVASRPEGVKAWAAYSVNVWVPPAAGKSLPPGLVACGQYDDSRYPACLRFVQQARALHLPVAWVSLPEIGHRRSLELEDFVREYFDAVLRPVAGDRPVAVDVGKETEIEPKEPWQYLLSGELPTQRLVNSWRELNDP